MTSAVRACNHNGEESADQDQGSKKLKCTGEQPACSRCEKKGLTCVYAVQKPIGRPRKRRLVEDDEPLQLEVENVATPKTGDHLGVWSLPPSNLPPAWDEDDGQWFDGRGFGTPLMPEITPNPWPPLSHFGSGEHQDAPSSNAVPELAGT